MQNKRVVLVVGHSEILRGATNEVFKIDGEVASEYLFNKRLAKRIVQLNKKPYLDLVIEYRDTDYEALPNEVNEKDGDLVISMHCNAFNKKASGCETLYYKHTTISDRVAKAMNDELCRAMQNTNRGIKPREHNRALRIFERGAYLMKYVKAPCVICEPFFIDNYDELNYAFLNEDKLALAYLVGIEKSLRVLKEFNHA